MDHGHDQDHDHDLAEVDAVLLDVGGVLILPDPSPIRRSLLDRGLDPPSDVEAYRRAHYVGAAAYDASADAPETWNAYHAGYARALGYDGERLRAATDVLLDVWRDPDLWSWRQDAAVDALVRLADLDLALGIVSNSDGTLEQRLLDLAVCQRGVGDHVEMRIIVDSAVVGYEKPHPATFAPAVDALGIAPERIVFVGDTVRNDVAGAEAVGLVPLHLDPYDLHPAPPHRRITNLAQLADALTP